MFRIKRGISFKTNSLRIYILLFILIGLISCQGVGKSSGSPNGANENFHLYLLIGQSNMAGRGQVDSLSNPNNSNILMLNENNEWEIAKDPLHFDKPKVAGVGPGLSFAQHMILKETNKRVTIGLIPCAVGGTGIQSWLPGATAFEVHPYDDAIKRLDIAMKKGVLKGILWHQGEGNSNEKHAKTYLAKLKELIARLRSHAGNDKLPFVAGELGHYRPRYRLINNVLQELPSTVPHTAVANARGLTHKGDSTHLNAASARLLGRRFAEKMLELQMRIGRNDN